MKIIPFLTMAGLICAGTQAYAQGGYEGVFAPPAAEVTGKAPPPADEANNSAYEGVLAPAPQAQPLTTRAAIEKPAPLAQTTLAPTPQMSTRSPYSSEVPLATSAQSLQLLSQAHGWQKERLREPQKLSPEKLALLENSVRNQGRPPIELMIEKKLEVLMPLVQNPALPAQQRADNAHKAYKELNTLAEGLRAKKGISDATYKKVGLSEAYVQRERQTTENALTMLDNVLRELKKY